jgi:hypothetical protein
MNTGDQKFVHLNSVMKLMISCMYMFQISVLTITEVVMLMDI